MKKISVFKNSNHTINKRLKRCNVFSMYSTTNDYITTDINSMMIPIDDHLVHRGDGVFETLKCLDGNIYNLDAHLERLIHSCDQIGLKIPVTKDNLENIIIQTTRAGNQKDAMIRILVSRGLGTMGINPYECTGEQLYVIVYAPPINNTSVSLLKGAKVAISDIPIKSGVLATVKTCNYLPNVLMKKEAIDKNVDFTISIDEQGFLGEGATENIGIVSSDNRLLMPSPERILSGTTAKRVMDLGTKLVSEGILSDAIFTSIPKEMIFKAKEVHIYGTGHNILPVIKVNSTIIGDGLPGPVWKKLHHLIHHDMTPKSRMLTPVFNISI